VVLLLTNTEHEVFVDIPVLSTSAALSDFSLSPKVERSGNTPFILTIDEGENDDAGEGSEEGEGEDEDEPGDTDSNDEED
jgi:hypothetical protein